MANPQEHELTYVLGDTLPAAGHTLEIAPGVRWLRMGLPFALDHINLWLVRDELDGRQGWTIVDCGIANDATRAAWERIFAEELDGLPVLRVLVTHMHPDHIGLAHWLTTRWSTPESPCRLWISLSDWNAARMASISTTGFGGEAAAAFFGSHGVTDPAALDKVRQRGNYYASMVPAVPQQFRRMMEGQRLTMGGHVWTCHAGFGHAPEHISLHCEALGVLISGDMVLPRISTNISVIDIEPEADPLPLIRGGYGLQVGVRPAGSPWRIAVASFALVVGSNRPGPGQAALAFAEDELTPLLRAVDRRQEQELPRLVALGLLGPVPEILGLSPGRRVLLLSQENAVLVQDHGDLWLRPSPPRWVPRRPVCKRQATRT